MKGMNKTEKEHAYLSGEQREAAAEYHLASHAVGTGQMPMSGLDDDEIDWTRLASRQA